MKRSPWVELFLVAAAFLTVRPLAIAETGKAMVREGGGTFSEPMLGTIYPKKTTRSPMLRREPLPQSIAR